MKKVITYGTFDLFHQGHYNILKRAKDYGDYLIVGVTGENYDIRRGKLSVHDSLAQRIENVYKTGLVDEIIVEEYLGQKIGDILRYGVDTFVIGDDWKGKFDHLSKYCNMVYLERTQGISSTQIRENSFRIYSIGIVTDSNNDNQIVKESKRISGFEVKSCYSENREVAKRFSETFDIDNNCSTFDDLIELSDIIYVRNAVEDREKYIRLALSAGRHVIADPPFAMSERELEELYRIADAKNVVLIENTKMNHIYVFNQLLWMTQGGLIGDVLSFNCSISRIDKFRTNLFYDLLSYALSLMLKIMGLDYASSDIKLNKGSDGTINFASIHFDYEDARATLNIGDKIRVSNQFEIIGTEGTIRGRGNWWRGDYFEIEKPDQDELEIYNTNYTCNGFKYLLKDLYNMLENGRREYLGGFREQKKMAEIIDEIKSIN